MRVVAGSQGTMNNFVYGKEELQNYETICGGTRITGPEVLEMRFPVRNGVGANGMLEEPPRCSSITTL